MKHLFFLIVFILVMIRLDTAQTSPNEGNSCDIHALTDSCKRVLKPFLYSAQSAVHVALKSEAQVKDVTFPAFQGSKYRLIINTLFMPKGTEVDVYDQDPNRKNKKQLYSSKSPGVSNFDLESKSQRIWVEYTIPAATATSNSGCAVVVFGFESQKMAN